MLAKALPGDVIAGLAQHGALLSEAAAWSIAVAEDSVAGQFATCQLRRKRKHFFFEKKNILCGLRYMPPTPRSPRYLLILLMCVVAVHNIDRVGFSIVLESIKRAMSLSDTQLGLLGRPTFALLSASAAIPLARLADRFGRRKVLATCIILWSGFTSLCGLSTRFTQLLVARACVGFADCRRKPGVACPVAAAYKPSRLPGVMAILLSGSYLGAVAGVRGRQALSCSTSAGGPR